MSDAANKATEPYPAHVHDTVALERFKFAVFQYLAVELARDFALPAQVELSAHSLFTCDALVIRVRQEVLGETLERVVVEYPANWWQAFRQRWAPAWWLRRYPIQLTRRTVEVWALYPKVTIPPHQARAYLHVHDGVQTLS